MFKKLVYCSSCKHCKISGSSSLSRCKANKYMARDQNRNFFTPNRRKIKLELCYDANENNDCSLYDKRNFLWGWICDCTRSVWIEIISILS